MTTIEHPIHRWQYVQPMSSDHHPANAVNLYFVCECGAYKDVPLYRDFLEVTYQLPTVQATNAINGEDDE